MKKLLCALLLLFSSLGMVFALDDQGQPNDPNINERANACFEDGSMADKCDTAWEWAGGWYLIRFEAGLISREDFPPQFYSLLPPLPIEELSTAPYVLPTAGCVAYQYNILILATNITTYVNFNGGNFIPNAVPYWNGSVGGCVSAFGLPGLNLAYAPNGLADAIAICRTNGFATASSLPANYNPVIYSCS